MNESSKEFITRLTNQPYPSRSIIYQEVKNRFPKLNRIGRYGFSRAIEGFIWNQPDKIKNALISIDSTLKNK